MSGYGGGMRGENGLWRWRCGRERIARVGVRGAGSRGRDMTACRREPSNTRVAHTLVCMYAPHEHTQHPRHRALSVACPGFLTVADIKGYVGATHEVSNLH
jgi:hypothetical protein